MNLMNSKKFGLLIESIVKEKKISYMDAVIHFCEKNDVDITTVGPMINKSLKEKIQIEAQKLNMLNLPKSNTLPIWQKF